MEATSKRIGRAGRVALSVTSTLLTLLLCECGARVWLGAFASRGQIVRYGTAEQVERLPSKYARHHYLPFIPAPGFKRGQNRHNALGFRGEEIARPKPEGTFRIALVGGSTTYTVDVDDYQKSYPSLLQRYLRERHPSVEVINAGCPMYSSWESLINLEFRVLDLEPDLVIVYHGINDVHPRIVHPPEAYVGDNSGSRQPFAAPERSLWDHSALLRVARTNLGLRDPGAGQGFFRTFQLVPTNYATAFREQVLSGTYPSGALRERSVGQMLEDNGPTYFARNLLSMAAISRMHGAEILLMTFAWSPDFPDRPRVSSAEYQEAFREQNALILELCEARGIACYDFASEMPRDKRLWTDGRHVNERGAERKARLVARYLEGSGLLLRRSGAGEGLDR